MSCAWRPSLITPILSGRGFFLFISLNLSLGNIALAGSSAPTFQTAVSPVLAQNCTGCHNEKLSSGGLNIRPFLEPGSLAANREGWERILSKVHSGEMPPKGIPHPPVEQTDALEKFVQGEFDRVDRAAKPNAGRVTARRLNRAEYANSVRDLLGVHFSVNDEFPPDDSGYGFDNIGDVLTVSPVLMQRYLAAAEKIASRAVGADPLPKPGVFNMRAQMLRKDLTSAEATNRVEFDAEYIFRATLAGHRGAQGKPVTLVLLVDGVPVKTSTVSTVLTEVTQKSGGTQRVMEEIRVKLSEGPHVFRTQFPGDDFIQATDGTRPANALNANKNIFTESMEIVGPFAAPQNKQNHSKLLVCDPALGRACLERILTPLVHRAFRHPIERSDVAEFLGVADKAAAAGYSPAESVQFALTALLVSPQFLFRIEQDTKPGLVGHISDVELASRLSYFLWSSLPDEELLRVAEAKKLHLPLVIDAQVKRMLSDSKSSALGENFAGQWLEIRSLDAMKPDPKKFPDWGPELKEAMRTETRMFFDAVVRENRPVSDFLDGNYTFLNEQLAKHYGIPGVTGSEFRRVALATDERGGVLTHGSVLTVSSYSARTSVVLRGKFVLENFLGAAPPPPPPDIPALDETATGTSQSLRQQMEKHRSSAACASCHSRMDVLGFGLENYDAVGRWRTKDGKFAIDPSGTFPNGKSFNTPAEMKAVLHSNLPEFTRTLTEKMMIYATGRGLHPYDRLAVKDIVAKTGADDYRFQTLISGIVHSLPFQGRSTQTPGADAVPTDTKKIDKQITKEIARK